MSSIPGVIAEPPVIVIREEQQQSQLVSHKQRIVNLINLLIKTDIRAEYNIASHHRRLKRFTSLCQMFLEVRSGLET